MKPISIVPDAKHPGMFRLQWRDGVLSADCYNRTRATDILGNYDEYVSRTNQSEMKAGTLCGANRKPVDAFTETGLTLTSS